MTGFDVALLLIGCFLAPSVGLGLLFFAVWQRERRAARRLPPAPVIALDLSRTRRRQVARRRAGR